MTNLTIAVPFVRMDADQNPNMKINDTTEQQNAYWRSMFVTLASFRRWNPDSLLQVTTNAPLPTWVENQFRGIDIKTRIVQFEHRAPKGFSKTFGGSVYLLDAVRDQHVDEDLALVDPDVLCLKPMDAVHEACRQAPGVLHIDTQPDEPNNGLTLSEARAIHSALGGSDAMPSHVGGEFLVIPGARRDELWAHVEQAWADSLARFERGEVHMATEEHVLTYAFSRMDVVELSSYVRRIWTAAKYRTVQPGDRDLTVWHLPSEKERGFRELYPVACDYGSWFWWAPQEEFVDRAGKALGLWQRQGRRLARDLAGGLASGRARQELQGLRTRIAGRN